MCVDLWFLLLMQKQIVFVLCTLVCLPAVHVPYNGVPYGKNDMLVIRTNALGQLCDSKPCCMCINMMYWFGIRRVYYSDSNGNILCSKIADLLDDNEFYVSHGLRMLITTQLNYISSVTFKLPLTKKQKKIITENFKQFPKILRV